MLRCLRNTPLFSVYEIFYYLIWCTTNVRCCDFFLDIDLYQILFSAIDRLRIQESRTPIFFLFSPLLSFLSNSLPLRVFNIPYDDIHTQNWKIIKFLSRYQITFRNSFRWMQISLILCGQIYTKPLAHTLANVLCNRIQTKNSMSIRK